jgi:hypothetical protein
VNNKIAILIAIGVLSAFAIERPPHLTEVATVTAGSKMINPREGYIYIRFLTADADILQVNAVTPGLGLGYRRMVGDGAVDMSISGNGSDRFRKAYWTFPKASYLHYLTADKEQSFYAGGGIAWGGVHNKKGKNFVGLIPHATVGYEILHKSSALGFTEMTLSQPAISLYHEGQFSGPIVELSVGTGF